MAEVKREFVHAECQAWLEAQPESSIHCCVTDAPYGLSTVSKTGKRSKGGFMGKRWDYDVPSVDMWTALLRVLKPGGSLLCFAGTRTQHRMAVNIEDAGFTIVDTLMWVYGEGFPKAHGIGKLIDNKLGAIREVVGTKVGLPGYRAGPTGATGVTYDQSNGSAKSDITAPATDAAKQWDGYKSHALKPAYEPIILAMKPNEGSYADNALKHGVAGLNVEACRVPSGDDSLNGGAYSGELRPAGSTRSLAARNGIGVFVPPTGRYPSNLLHDGSDEVLAGFPATQSGALRAGFVHRPTENRAMSGGNLARVAKEVVASEGSAARFFPSLGWTEDELRFFYTAKASKGDRGDGNDHPTVKPVKLMRWLVRLVCPPGGTVLDPFMGSGTTAVACHEEQLSFIGVEREAESIEIARNRIRSQCAQVMLEL